jgi:hypothetical protein
VLCARLHWPHGVRPGPTPSGATCAVRPATALLDLCAQVRHLDGDLTLRPDLRPDRRHHSLTSYVVHPIPPGLLADIRRAHGDLRLQWGMVAVTSAIYTTARLSLPPAYRRHHTVLGHDPIDFTEFAHRERHAWTGTIAIFQQVALRTAEKRAVDCF